MFFFFKETRLPPQIITLRFEGDLMSLRDATVSRVPADGKQKKKKRFDLCFFEKKKQFLQQRRSPISKLLVDFSPLGMVKTTPFFRKRLGNGRSEGWKVQGCLVEIFESGPLM